VLLAVSPTVSTAVGSPEPRTHPRDPLAVQLGLVERGEVREHARLTAGREATDLFLRTPSDSLIAALMDSTSLARITADVQRLQDFGTRYVTTDSCWAAGYWVADRFAEMGYADVRLDTFRTMSFQDSVDAMNVIAVKEGTTRPSEYVIIGGHYDSVTADNFADPDAPAPGAEDNATAVAAVFEAARLLRDVPTDRSIMFACWSAEEVGTWGSRAFVADAVAESLDIVVYLNMDCIGYLDPEAGEEPITVYTDSLSLAIAGYMQTLTHEHSSYGVQTRVQPFGASDHNSFWEERYRVVDTGTTISSPYRHTTDDTIENIDLEFCRVIAAVNVAACASVAGVTGENPNLPPETVALDCCAASAPAITMTPTFEWYGVDFDGNIAQFEYVVQTLARGSSAPAETAGAHGSRVWQQLPPDQTTLTLHGLIEATHVLSVRATDDDGAVDPSPAQYVFTTDASLRPELMVDTNFLPDALTFTGEVPERRGPVRVFEGERLVFEAVSDASSYCGVADSVAFAVNDTSTWSDWFASPFELAVAADPGDTLIAFRTRDENGEFTMGSVSVRVVPAPMDRPLLHLDDWFDPSVTEDDHDRFYETVLTGETCDVWDPFEHIEDYRPTLPSMEEMGRYRTILWTLDWHGGLLLDAQAESAYHSLEGFVRAGGNLIVEGQSSLLTLAGSAEYGYDPARSAGDFLYEHVGVDSIRNAGSYANPTYPWSYGYAFLGGTSIDPWFLPDAPVDTLGKWADGYQTYGGVPLCEIVRPREGTQRLYLFDSYLNPELAGRPCATLRHAGDGTGSVAWLGFPLYYIETEPAREIAGTLLRSFENWWEPAELAYFDLDTEPDSVVLSWYLSPADPALECALERKEGPAGEPDDYVALAAEPIAAGPDDRYRFVDVNTRPGRTYSYRLRVRERYGAVTTHGPWEAAAPVDRSSPWLEPPWPNPFTPDLASGGLAIRYGVAADYRWVTVGVYDVAGRLVRELERGPVNAGVYDASWDGASESGEPVASGVYFVRARVGDERLERKVVLLR